MFNNYLRIAIRLLIKKPGYTLIHVLGLSVGLSCFFILALFIAHELSYDSFHAKQDRIYRIGKKGFTERFLGTDEWVRTAYPLGETLTSDFPEVTAQVKITESVSFFEKGTDRYEEKGIFAAGNLFEVFSFNILRGDPNTTFDKPDQIFLSARLAHKYFGDANPLNRTIPVSYSGPHFSGDLLLTVAGVIEDLPDNSHLSFDYIVPASSSHELRTYINSWSSNNYLTYVLLAEQASDEAFTEKLSVFRDPVLPEQENFSETTGSYFAQPLGTIHLHSAANGEFKPNGNIRYVYLFSGIALIILSIACINYINLSVARSSTRIQEVGVRKSIGATFKQLFLQFTTESTFLGLISSIATIGIVQSVLPLFGSYVGRDLVYTFTTDTAITLAILGSGVMLGFFSGSYPALILSRFNPIKNLKNYASASFRRPSLQKALVTTQFAATVALILGTTVIYKQLHYIRNSSTGLDRTHILSVSVKDKSLYEKYNSLKETLEQHPSITLVSAAQSDPISINASSKSSGWQGMQPDETISVYRSAIQHDFVDLFGLELVEGRDFSNDMLTDEQTSILINEALKNRLGWKTAIDKTFSFRGREGVITGVVKNFNHNSYKYQIEPLALFLETDWWFPYQKVFIKMDGTEVSNTIDFIDQTFARFSPGYPLDYKFMDDAYNTMYLEEARLANLLNFFALSALFIACLGILGLATHTISKRGKEIGIRKVIGASTSSILWLLSKDFMKPVSLGCLIAAPIAWYVAHQWLLQFSYRISVGASAFLFAIGLTVGIAFLTVAWQTISIARINPSQTLKSE